MRYLVSAFFLFVAFSTLAGAAGEDFVYNENGQRDPFWPLVTLGGAIVNYDATDVTASEMVLEGVIGDGVGGIAIINGTVVEQGKSIGTYIVEKIEPGRVILIKDGQETELRLKREE